MSAITKLIRFHRFLLDERRRGLKKLEENLSEIDGEIFNLRTQIDHEKKFSSKNYEGGRDLSNFIAATLERIKEKGHDRNLALGKVEAAREEVREAFAEVKKYEITEDIRRKKELAENERRERTELDESALDGHRRRTQ